ncbi:hypothetical protein F1C58_16785 (plasmid) [Glaciihabitans sp. INWT7]|uniref:hypothetical protein n=1 Tax=Glaciihabitans sp. INWT7 TaxID=2596912 RepID=UPI0016234274|nr:hypothetical protein [Glaciihabitans sp. INWT7]QNE48714.1 hypothetical protein F1C58_16785 [Glaciihabitans sp. INWT7]
MSDTNLGAATIRTKPVNPVGGENAPALTITLPLLGFDNIPSACPDDDVRLGKRIDPYYADIWPVGAKASWVDAASARSQVAAGIGRLPAYLVADEETAAMKVTDVSRLPAHLNVLSVLDSWRSATGEQLAAFTGLPHLATGKSKTMTDLFTTELVDVGIFSNVLFTTRNTARGALYRLNAGGGFEKHVAPILTYAEWLSTTAGLKNTIGGGHHDRHNVITMELALRIAELCDVGTVVGEKLSSADLHGYSGLGLPASGAAYNRAADMTVIRNDGARIAIEVTASGGRALEMKVKHWAQLIASRRMDESGLTVVFVLIDPDRKDNAGGNRIRNNLFKLVRKTVGEMPGVSFDRVASRMGVADWREWFPEPGVVSPSFFELDCERPTGPPEALWERASFLSEDDVPFAPDGDWATAVLDNMSMLRSVPHWLKEGRTAPDLHRVQLAAAGLSKIPVPSISRPELTPGTREFGKAFGFVADTKPPKRMRLDR